MTLIFLFHSKQTYINIFNINTVFLKSSHAILYYYILYYYYTSVILIDDKQNDIHNINILIRF